MWQLKSEANGKSKSEIQIELSQLFMSMKGVIIELKNIEVGINVESEISNYDLVLTTEFNNFDDLKVYIAHPYHQNIIPIVKNYTISRACVDYNCN